MGKKEYVKIPLTFEQQLDLLKSRGLKIADDKKRIADFFDLHTTVFTSWLHSLTYVRNICAHHSRLWNRELAIEPEKLLKPVGGWMGIPSDYKGNLLNWQNEPLWK